MSKTIDVEAGDEFGAPLGSLRQYRGHFYRYPMWDRLSDWYAQDDMTTNPIPRDRALAALRAMGYEVVEKEPDLPRVRVTHGLALESGLVAWWGTEDACRAAQPDIGGKVVALDFGGVEC